MSSYLGLKCSISLSFYRNFVCYKESDSKFTRKLQDNVGTVHISIAGIRRHLLAAQATTSPYILSASSKTAEFRLLFYSFIFLLFYFIEVIAKFSLKAEQFKS